MKKSVLFFGLVVLILACQNGQKGNEESSNAEINVKKLFKIHCVLCHGVDGTLQMNGAKDLTKSPLTLLERKEIITRGKNTMTAFGDILSKKEIEALAKYTLNIKK